MYLKLNTKSTNICSKMMGNLVVGNTYPDVLAQWDAGITGTVCAIAGEKYIILKVTIKHARSHQDAVAGTIILPQIQYMYHEKEGFRLHHDGMSIVLTLM